MEQLILYTALDGDDAVVVPGIKQAMLPENLRYTYALSRRTRKSNLFAVMELETRFQVLRCMEDLPPKIRALIMIYDM